MKKVWNGILCFGFSSLVMVNSALAMASRPPADPNAPPPPSWVTWAPIFFMVFIFYFLLIRPQAKQKRERQQLLGNLKKGDKIITQGGFFGTIINIGPDYFEVKLNEETKVKILKTAVADVIPEKNQAVEPTVISSK